MPESEVKAKLSLANMFTKRLVFQRYANSHSAQLTMLNQTKLIWMPDTKPPVPTMLEVTKFMPSTVKNKRKLMFNSTPIVKR
jgi:hypothetical protein